MAVTKSIGNKIMGRRKPKTIGATLTSLSPKRTWRRSGSSVRKVSNKTAISAEGGFPPDLRQCNRRCCKPRCASRAVPSTIQSPINTRLAV